MSEVKWTGSGQPVLVIGPGQVRHTTHDEGRTVDTLEQVTVVRFADGVASVEDVEPDSLFDFRPTQDLDTASPVTNEQGEIVPPDEVPEEKRVVTEVPAATPGGTQRGEQQDEEIAAKAKEQQDEEIAAKAKTPKSKSGAKA